MRWPWQRRTPAPPRPAPPPPAPTPVPPPSSSLPTVTPAPSKAAAGNYWINLHLSYPGPWENTAAAVARVVDLGVAGVRQRLPYAGSTYALRLQDRVLDGLQLLDDAAIRLYVPIVGPEVAGQPDTWIRTYVRAQLDALERRDLIPWGVAGVNEPNGAKKDIDGWAPLTRLVQRIIWEEVRARRAWDSCTVGSSPLNLRGWDSSVQTAVRELGDLGPWCSVGDTHLYTPGGPEFYAVSDMLKTLAPTWGGAGRGVLISEIGWTTPDPGTYQGGGGIVPVDVQAQYLAAVGLAHFRAGRGPVMVYELYDEPTGTVTDAEHDMREAHFGVGTPSADGATWQPKPSHGALQRTLALLRDTGTATPRPLALRVTGGDTLRWQLLDHSDGRWRLALWRTGDAYTWDPRTRAGKRIVPTYDPVKIELGQRRALTVHRPTTATPPEPLGAGLAVATVTVGGPLVIVTIA